MAWTSDSLRKLFAGLLATGAGGCAEEAVGIERRQFDMGLCSEGNWYPQEAVSPQEAVNYLEMRVMIESEFAAEDDRFGDPQIQDAHGQKCGGAPEGSACGTEFAARPYLSEIGGYNDFGDIKLHKSAVPAPRIAPMPLKDMVALAADNAAEGCVRETFWALVAHAQARHAQDPDVRRVMHTIARDETWHAALSWRVAGWARIRMGSAERARVTPGSTRFWACREPAEAGAPFFGLHAGLLRQLEA